MKYLFTLLLISSTYFAQAQDWPQWGSSIEGEGAVDQSGWSVSTNAEGNIVAIGAVGNDDAGTNTGYVRIYENIDGDWVQTGDDINGVGEEDRSGYSVSLNNEGNIVAIGAPLNDGGGGGSGHVRVFKNIDGAWEQVGADIEGDSSGDFSGWSVSLNGDGTVLAIGATLNDDGGENAGQVRVFEYITDTWVQKGGDIDGNSSGDLFGRGVSLSDDGNIVAAGAALSYGAGPLESGRARVFEFVDGEWEQIGSNLNGENFEDWNGFSVSLSGDGSRVAVGAPQNDDAAPDAGYVRVYENIAGSWTLLGDKILGEGMGDECGNSVSLNFDGSIVAVGAKYNSGAGTLAGHVRLYEFVDDGWVQIGDDLEGQDEQDHFGQSVCLNSAGTVVAIGSDATGDGTSPGRTKIYKYCQYLDVTITAETFCVGEEVTLTAVSETGGTVTWEGDIENGVPFIPALGVTDYSATSDSDGDCPYTTEIEIFDHPTVNANVDYDEVCFGQSVVFTGSGASSYDWDMGVTNGVPFTPDETGTETYTVIGTDENGCVDTADIDVTATEFDPIEITYTTEDEIFGSDGEIDITVTGGAGGYDYDWDNDGSGDFDDPQDLTGVSGGTYEINILDNAGCEGNETITVDSQLGIVNEVNSPISIYPNPNNGQFYISNADDSLERITVLAMNGQTVYTQSFVSDGHINLQGTLVPGTYVLELKYAEQKKHVKLIIY